MTPLRSALAAGAVVLIALAFANVLLWHAFYWIPIGWYATLLLLGAIFEARRYRPNVDRTSATWKATGERFFDPTTGEATTVYFDPATGQRDYRDTGSPQTLR